MGNQNSRAATPSASPQSPSSGTASSQSHGASPEQRAPYSHNTHSQFHHAARRRESIPALSVKAQAAPPSASLEHAESHPTSTRPHSRGRSQTTAAAASTPNYTTTTPSTPDVASQLRAAHDSFKAASHDSSATTTTTTTTTTPAMGNEQSTQKGRDKARDQARDLTPPVSSRATPPPQTRPVDVPALAREDTPSASKTAAQPIPAASIDPADASQDYVLPSSHFSRPPRLPLPIGEEDHTPGSPILSPIGEPDGALPKRSSILSNTTAEDDDLGDEFKGPNTTRPTVPTLIEWEDGGERVYVTGTFAGWNRKYRLHRNGPSPKKDILSAYVPITPGTHHLMFIVDQDMKTSDKLPTAVDYTNILVNYLEVSYDDVPKPLPTAAQPKDTPAKATPVQEREAPAGVYPPQVLPPTPELQPVKAPLPEPAKPKVPEPTKRYHQNIPRYLLDLDAAEESSRFARANATTSSLPMPPSLPGFLGKSILNGTTPMKDDSSVLIHPNHTVLNHLATSSIKDNILATSATTRYKQKFLTTIMYKPKEDGGEVAY